MEDLASVRHLKRYVNLTLPRYRKVYSKVDPADFFLLSLLQYRHLTIYNNLARHMYIELFQGQAAFYYIPSENQDVLSKNLPPEAWFLMQRLFVNRNTRPGEISDSLRFGELKLIRSEEAFPYYFRYVKDSAEEE